VRSASSNRAAEDQLGGRALEILAVLLLGIATLGSAWCGYQASRWNSEQGKLSQQSSDQQVEAARLFGLATQRVSYDSNMVAQYAQAVVASDERLKRFYRQTLIRPAFLPILDIWEAQLAAGGTPTNLVTDSEYLDAQLADSRAAQARAEASTVASEAAGQNADDYVLTTLLFASALFFAGVTTSFRLRFARILMLGGAALVLAYAASRLVGYPIA
jgi:hypothetical protein